MAEIVALDFHDLPVRMFRDEANEPWFVAKDVCDILKIKNSNDAISSLDDEDKGVAKADTLGGIQEMTTVNEPGLYHLIFKSRVKAAKEFKRWLTKEVLPSIRKTGKYEMAGEVTGEMTGEGLPDFYMSQEYLQLLHEKIQDKEKQIYYLEQLVSTQENAAATELIAERNRFARGLAEAGIFSAEDMAAISGGDVDFMELWKNRIERHKKKTN